MFTGLIKAVGKITSIERKSNEALLCVEWKDLPTEVKIGDSISVNGVCLTATTITPNWFSAVASQETLEKTNLGELQENAPVNLELPLQNKSFLGGHFVQGHIDDTGKIVSIESQSDCHKLRFSFPKNLSPYIAEKGSIAVDGTSLTINSVQEDSFEVTIIPHTWKSTIAHHYKVNQKVNLESDILAKYVQRAFQKAQEALQA